jgi:hypothetical protein
MFHWLEPFQLWKTMFLLSCLMELALGANNPSSTNCPLLPSLPELEPSQIHECFGNSRDEASSSLVQPSSPTLHCNIKNETSKINNSTKPILIPDWENFAAILWFLKRAESYDIIYRVASMTSKHCMRRNTTIICKWYTYKGITIIWKHIGTYQNFSILEVWEPDRFFLLLILLFLLLFL